MRVITFVSVMLWVRWAAAAPGVIAVPSAEAYAAPSDAARLISELQRGDPVCVVDEAHDAAVAEMHPGPGWLAIRLPIGVGYVRREAVDVSPTSSTPDHHCADAAPAIQASEPVPEQPAWRPPSAAAGPPVTAGSFLPRHPVRISLGLGSGAAWLPESVAAQHHIGSLGPTFNATIGLTIYDLFEISGLGGGAFPADHASFSQDVVPLLGGGDASSAESHLEVQSYSIAVGLRTPFLVIRPGRTGGLAAAVFADYGWSTIHGVRMISDCTGCRKEDFGMAGGSFWRAGFDLAAPFAVPWIGYSLSASYLSYGANAGVSEELRVGCTIWML